MTSTALTLEASPEYKTLDSQLTALIPKFEQMMGACGVPAERIVRTVMVSIERNPKLLECDRQSIINAAMSAAVLGLEVDGVTGQAFLIPFKNKVQLVVGYKGFPTMAARSGITINSGIVKEGDEFDYAEGTGSFVRHKKKLGNTGRIVAAWAVAEAKTRPPIVKVLGIDDIMKVKAKAPGARRSDSPWNDTDGPGFPAMVEKTAIRRLGRNMPLNVFQYAAAMDEAFEERGLHSYVDPDRGTVIEGQSSPIASSEKEQPEAKGLAGDNPFVYMVPGKGAIEAKTFNEWEKNIQRRLATFKTVEYAREFMEANRETFDRLAPDHPYEVAEIIGAIESIIVTLMEKGEGEGDA